MTFEENLKAVNWSNRWVLVAIVVLIAVICWKWKPRARWDELDCICIFLSFIFLGLLAVVARVLLYSLQ